MFLPRVLISLLLKSQNSNMTDYEGVDVLKDNNMIVGFCFGLVASLIWGCWPVISKWAQIHAINATEITLLRFFVSGIILCPVLFYLSVSWRTVLTKGVALSIGAGLPYVWLAMQGIERSSSAHFGIIAPSCMLIFSTLGGVFFLSETISYQRLLGVLLIVLGVFLVGFQSFMMMNKDVLIGDLMCVGCGALWASFTLLSKYWRLNSWVATAMVSVVSGVFCLPIYAFNVNELFVHTSGSSIFIHGLFQGILVAILALFCYSKSVSLLGAAKGAVFAALVPPFALCLGVLILNESVTWVEVVGILFVFSGMIFALGFIVFPRKVLSVKRVL